MKVPIVRRDARPRRYFNGRWYSPNRLGYWRCDHVKGGAALLHRAVWAFHHGPIDRSVVIEFKDGDRRNCDINNLRCVKKVPPNVWTLWKAGLRGRPVDRVFGARVRGSRRFWARMSAGEREIYCILRGLACRDAQRDRKRSRQVFQMMAAGGAINARSR
jgi:hypothetical protein